MRGLRVLAKCSIRPLLLATVVLPALSVTPASSEAVVSGVLRVVTHPRVCRDPTPLDTALAFMGEVRDHPNCISVSPRERLCRAAGVRGSLVPDAYLAAVAIESGAEWMTADRDYARFPGPRRRHPLD